MIRFFLKFNQCHDDDYVVIETVKKSLFKINIRPGLNISSFSFDDQTTTPTTTYDFGSKVGVRLGIEAEYFLPFNNNQWSLIVEPTYQFYQTEKSFANENISVNYKSIELPLGLRYYYYLNKESKIFINGLFAFDFDMNSSISIEPTLFQSNVDISSKNNLAFGIGYKQGTKYSFELRYAGNREILSNFVFRKSNFSSISLIFGYTIFE